MSRLQKLVHWGGALLFSSVLVGCQLTTALLEDSNESVSPTQYPDRHIRALWGKLPKLYEGVGNPLKTSKLHISVGRTLYRIHCSHCHGQLGMGDGKDGTHLVPPPARLYQITTRPFASDSYLNWTISEGGTDFKTAMPSFKKTLTQTQVWQIALYLKLGIDFEPDPYPPVQERILTTKYR
jgi:mono/diheme cytochrome c family protein